MAEVGNSPSGPAAQADGNDEGRLEAEMDIDRMVNEGLGGGQVTAQNGRIGDTTTDDMDAAAESRG